MLRDRLRKWGLNDKNRRSTASERRVTCLNNNQKLVAILRNAPRELADQTSSQSDLRDIIITHPPPTPNDARSVQQALKSMMDWHSHFHDSDFGKDEILIYTDRFYFLLRSLSVSLKFDRSDQSMCGAATRRLGEASASLQGHLKPMCTPLAVLSSIQLILRIVNRRDSDEWYKATSKFLLQTTAGSLPRSHPTLLLLQALLGDQLTPDGLYMIFEVGSLLVRRCYGGSTALHFRLDFISAALDIYPDAKFTIATGMLCDTANTAHDVLWSDALAEFEDDRRHRSYEVLSYVRGCSCYLNDRVPFDLPSVPMPLATIQERSADYYAWRILANSQRMQCGFAGEEISRLNAHALIVTMSNMDGGSRSDEDSLHIIRRLHLFYEEHDLDEQCQALRLEYPSAFEL